MLKLTTLILSCAVALFSFGNLKDCDGKVQSPTLPGNEKAVAKEAAPVDKAETAPVDEAEAVAAEAKAEPDLLAAPIEGEILLVREGYTCSYNTTTFQPNYVAWTLTPQKLEGTIKRSGSFYEDPDLSKDQKALLEDYYNSGFDRGHMCPAADNKWSAQAMHDCFYLSNMSPQTHTLNAGDWEQLESACRSWVKRGNVTIHIVCGPLFEGKTHRKINRRVPVPEKYFKAVVCTQEGKQKGIAFVYNNNTEQHPMPYYVCTIDEVEELTGFDLFATLSPALQEEIESQSNLSDWSRKTAPQQ